MSVKYRKVLSKDKKRYTIEFDFNMNGKRRTFRPGIIYSASQRTAQERQERKAKLQLADKMKAQMEIDELYAINMIGKGFQWNKDFFEYFYDFLERKVQLSEKRTYLAMLKKFIRYVGKEKLPCSDIDEEFLLGFKDYLDLELSGVSAYNYFKKLKRVIKEATIAKYFKTNPMAEIVNSKGKSKEKETLVFEEVKALLGTECRNEEIKTAFLFCCYTGIRFCDVQALTWNNIKKNNTLELVQIKTKERLTMDLHQDAVKLLEISKKQNNDKLVFQLPTSTTCLKVLREWVAKAGINKHITWHCSRHTFATLLNYQNQNITTISKLLGHKSLKETEIYIRVAENAKSKAVKSLRSMFK